MFESLVVYDFEFGFGEIVDITRYGNYFVVFDNWDPENSMYIRGPGQFVICYSTWDVDLRILDGSLKRNISGKHIM